MPMSMPPSTRRCSARSPTPGQICMSTERVIVDEKVADEFAAKAREARGRLARRRSAQGRIRHRLGGRQARRGAGATSGRGCRRQGRQGARRRRERRHGHEGHRGRSRDAGDAAVPRRVVRRRRSRSRASSPSTRRSQLANDTEYGLSAAVFSTRSRAWRSMWPGASSRDLPRQWPHRARRGADALRRREGIGLWPLRRQGRRSTSSPSCAGSRSRPGRATTLSENRRRERQA